MTTQKYYAGNERVAKVPFEGSVEITHEQYKDFIAAMTSENSETVAIVKGVPQVVSTERIKVYSKEDGSSKEIKEYEDVPTGYTKKERPSEFHVWGSGKWELDVEKKLNHLRENASMTRMEFMLKLDEMGLLDQIEQFVEESASKKVKIMFNNASSFDRLHVQMVQMAAELNFTDEQIDEVFGIEVGE